MWGWLVFAWKHRALISAVIKAARPLIAALKAKGMSEQEAGTRVESIILAPHKMTPAEEEIWMRHGSSNPPG